MGERVLGPFKPGKEYTMKHKDNEQNSPVQIQAADTQNASQAYKTAEAPEVPAWAHTRTAQDLQEDVAQTEITSGIDPNTRRPLLQGKFVTKNVILCNDGVYRWIYELNLFRHPTVFFTIWKIFFFIFAALFAIMSVADAIEWSRSLWESIVETAPMYGYLFLGATGLSAIGYLIYAAVTGGKLDIFYEMDETGVKQKQIPRRAGNPRVRAEAEAGLRSDRISSMAVTEYDTYTDFSRVKKGKIYPLSHYIKLKEGLNPDRIYSEKEDFEFIRDYIIAHCRELDKSGRNDLIKPDDIDPNNPRQ